MEMWNGISCVFICVLSVSISFGNQINLSYFTTQSASYYNVT